MKYFLPLLIIVITSSFLSVVPGDFNEIIVLAFVLLSIVFVPMLMAYSLKIFLSHFRLKKHQPKH